MSSTSPPSSSPAPDHDGDPNRDGGDGRRPHRHIVVDTETTGLDPASGDRVVEIGCIELVNHLPSERFFHTYLNPEREMPAGAFAVHGLSSEFLQDKPLFADVADAFLDFLAGPDDEEEAEPAHLVIHNAAFDLGFLNAELSRLSRPPLEHPVIDTVALARRRFPGAQANLDALCRRFEIDLSVRDKHGALVDAELLAAVYLELIGGRQPGLDLGAGPRAAAAGQRQLRPPRPPRPHSPSSEEAAAHAAFIERLQDPLWGGAS